MTSSHPPVEGNRADRRAEDVSTRSTPILEVANLEVVYNDVLVALRGVSLRVKKGSMVAVLGGNGAGKTTLLRAIMGLLDAHDGVVTRGAIRVTGKDTTHVDSSTIVRGGVALVPEGRRIFDTMTVEENLHAGGLGVRDRAERATRMERLYDLFPVLGDRRKRRAGYLSGGEQQMLAISRALMSGPDLLLLDEPSLGLAPKLVGEIRDTLARINETGTSIVLVEQNAHMALAIAEHGYVLENGKIVMDAASTELRASSDIQEFYLGLSSDHDRRNFREVKTYRRKKRWIS